MPELPEVETVRAGLERHVVGRTVATATVLNPRAVRRDPAGPDGFAAAMAGRTFLRAGAVASTCGSPSTTPRRCSRTWG